jgi:hypothetical protein
MNVSRETAVEEMKAAVKLIEKWIDELEFPRGVDAGGNEVPEFKGDVPSMLSVCEIKSISVPQLRAELAVAAAKLEAIAST